MGEGRLDTPTTSHFGHVPFHTIHTPLPDWAAPHPKTRTEAHTGFLREAPIFTFGNAVSLLFHFDQTGLLVLLNFLTGTLFFSFASSDRLVRVPQLFLGWQ